MLVVSAECSLVHTLLLNGCVMVLHYTQITDTHTPSLFVSESAISVSNNSVIMYTTDAHVYISIQPKTDIKIVIKLHRLQKFLSFSSFLWGCSIAQISVSVYILGYCI